MQREHEQPSALCVLASRSDHALRLVPRLLLGDHGAQRFELPRAKNVPVAKLSEELVRSLELPEPGEGDRSLWQRPPSRVLGVGPPSQMLELVPSRRILAGLADQRLDPVPGRGERRRRAGDVVAPFHYVSLILERLVPPAEC